MYFIFYNRLTNNTALRADCDPRLEQAFQNYPTEIEAIHCARNGAGMSFN